MVCPHCKLINPPTAQRCDCGYDFASGKMKESYLTERERKGRVARSTGLGSFVMTLLFVAGYLKNGHSSAGSLMAVVALGFLAGVLYWMKSRRGRKTY